MADRSDLLHLPIGFLSSGDPIEGNPFPTNDTRHKVWDEATRRAEEELCRFNSEILKARIDSPDAAVCWMSSVVVGKFDIWAKRGVHVVWSDGAVHAYDQWLANYAKAWLDSVNAADSFHAVVPRDYLLSELRLCLMERIGYWKAEARRYLGAQNVHSPSAANENAPSVLDRVNLDEINIKITNLVEKLRGPEEKTITRSVLNSSKKKLEMSPEAIAFAGGYSPGEVYWTSRAEAEADFLRDYLQGVMQIYDEYFGVLE